MTSVRTWSSVRSRVSDSIQLVMAMSSCWLYWSMGKPAGTGGRGPRGGTSAAGGPGVVLPASSTARWALTGGALGVLSSSSAAKVKRAVYAKAYRIFVDDNRLSETEAAYLDDLRRVLSLSNEDITAIERETLIPRFEETVAMLIQDGIVSLHERAAIDQLANDLRVSSIVRQELHAKPLARALNKALAERLTGRRMTDEDFDTFVDVARHLGVHPSFDNATPEALQRCAFLWRIESGEFPIIRASV